MVRIGIVGYGYWGPIITSCFQNAGYKIGAIADRHPERTCKILETSPDTRLYTDPQEIIDDSEIDALVICLPTSMHYDICKKALLSGKHVLVEKPLTNSSEQSAELVAIAREKGLVLMVDHQFAYKASVRELKRLIDEKKLGDLHYYDSSRTNLGLFRKDDDVIWDLAPHDLSILKYLLGKDPVSVSATAHAHLIAGKVDSAHISLFYGDGFNAHIYVSWVVPQKLRGVYVGGERGVALYDDSEPVNKLKLCEVLYYRKSENEIICKKGEWTAMAEDSENTLAEVAKIFVECIDTGVTPLSDGKFAHDIIKTIEAIQESVKKNGQEVSVGASDAFGAIDDLAD